MDIHADSLRVARDGHNVERPVNPRRILAAGMMGALTALLVIVRAILRRRGRPAR
jgi:hypothetical protein